MQRDAFERLDLKRMLAEPEMLEAVQPDVSLVSTLISMRALLGGGTDINRAVGYCAQRITRPEDTVLVLISDLYEGGVEAGLLAQAQRLVASGVQMVALLALSNEGRPPTTGGSPPASRRSACPPSPARPTASRR